MSSSLERAKALSGKSSVTQLTFTYQQCVGRVEARDHSTRFCANPARRRKALVTSSLLNSPDARRMSRDSGDDCVMSSSCCDTNCLGMFVMSFGRFGGRSGNGGCIRDRPARRCACTAETVSCQVGPIVVESFVQLWWIFELKIRKRKAC